MTPYQREIIQILPVVVSGGIVLYPTDTVWGLGCDITNPQAVARIAALKQLSTTGNMVILVRDIEMLEQYVSRMHPRLYAMHEFHERPVTVIYHNVRNLPPALIAPDGSAAIRIARDPFCIGLLKALGKPLLATAPCLEGEPIPATFEAIGAAFVSGVDYVAKYRQQETTPQLPSVMVYFSDKEELEFVRE